MAKDDGKKGKGDGGAGDLTVAILKQIRDHTEATAKDVAALKKQNAVLIEGQHDLARNVSQLNLAMIRLVEEVKDLRDEKYEKLEKRLALVEQQLAQR